MRSIKTEEIEAYMLAEIYLIAWANPKVELKEEESSSSDCGFNTASIFDPLLDLGSC